MLVRCNFFFSFIFFTPARNFRKTVVSAIIIFCCQFFYFVKWPKLNGHALGLCPQTK